MTVRESERRKRQSQEDRAAEQSRRDRHVHDEARLKPRVVAGRVMPSNDGVGIGHNGGAPLNADDLKVLSFKEWCRLCGFSPATGRRLVAAGLGPIITQLSVRRIGVSIANHRVWQASRARGVA